MNDAKARVAEGPAMDEVEVSVFGPGVGESIVLHLGDGEWMIVDSCRDRSTGRPVAITYLESLGLDPAICVRAVVATHWDSDHIRALGGVVEACPTAPFWCSAAVGIDDFDVLLQLSGSEGGPLGPRLLEMVSVLAALRARESESDDEVGRHEPHFAVESSMVLELPAENGLGRRVVHALSPSGRSIVVAGENLRHAASDPGKMRRRVEKMSRNDSSIALLIDLGNEGILLGGDLECSADPGRGWKPAARRARELGIAAGLVKIPHHGSANAYDTAMWDEMLVQEPAGALTPFFAGSPLPALADRERIRGHTRRCFLTADRATAQPAAVLSSVAPPDSGLCSVEGELGHVRWRRKLTSKSGEWNVALSNGAQAV